MPSAIAGQLWLSLHTDFPTAQNVNEVEYEGYARAPAPRDKTSFSVSGEDPAIGYFNRNLDFPECLGGNLTAKFFALGTQEKGPGVLLYTSRAFEEDMLIRPGIIPRVKAATMIQEF